MGKALGELANIVLPSASTKRELSASTSRSGGMRVGAPPKRTSFGTALRGRISGKT